MAIDPGPVKSRMEIVAKLEDSLPILISEACGALDEDLPAYQGVPLDDLQPSTQRTLGIVIRAIRTGVPEVLAEDVDPGMVRRRIERGVTPDEMVHASRRVAAVVFEHVQMEAHELALPHEEVLALTNLVWAVTDAMGVRVSEAYRSIDAQTARSDALRRDQFLHQVVERELSPAEVEQEARTFGLDPQMSVRGVWARPVHGGPEKDHERVRMTIAAQLAGSARDGLIGHGDGAWIGLVAGRSELRLRGDQVTVGVGPAVDLARATESLRLARAICAAAVRRGLPGIVELPDVTWRVAVHDDVRVMEVLRQRYLEPVVGEQNTRDAVKTLRAFLAADRNVQQAAAALSIHPNTLRYRLSRFEELTGRSLTSTEVIVELSWLLEGV